MSKIYKIVLLFIISNLFCFSMLTVDAKTDYFHEIVYIEDFTQDNIENYDLYHLLSYEETITFLNWLEDSYKFKLDKEKDYEFIKDNLSKFILLAM